MPSPDQPARRLLGRLTSWDAAIIGVLIRFALGQYLASPIYDPAIATPSREASGLEARGRGAVDLVPRHEHDDAAAGLVSRGDDGAAHPQIPPSSGLRRQ